MVVSDLFNKWIASLNTGKATAETYSRAICKPERNDIIAYRESLKKAQTQHGADLFNGS